MRFFFNDIYVLNYILPTVYYSFILLCLLSHINHWILLYILYCCMSSLYYYFLLFCGDCVP